MGWRNEKHVIRAVSFILLMIALLPCSRDHTAQAPCSELLAAVCEAVDRYARQLMAETATPGMAVALLLPDGHLEVRTYGVADMHSGLPDRPVGEVRALTRGPLMCGT